MQTLPDYFEMPKANDITTTWWGERDEIGRAYLDLVEAEHEADPVERAAWLRLGRETLRHAKGVRRMFTIEETPDPEPYPSARDMVRDLQIRGTLKVSTANCEHPIWPERVNVDFRTVHDGMGHYLSGGAFSWQGELDACSVHFRMVRHPHARRAMFTECIGQVAAYYVNGKQHAPQVVGFLPERFTRGILHA